MHKLKNGVELIWLGHATWLLTSSGGQRLLLDAWVDTNPACPDQYKGDGLGHLDLILVTHGHSDHVGDLVPIAKRTGATVVGIFDLIQWVQSKGIEDVVGLNKGATVEIAGLGVTLVHAVHSSSLQESGQLIEMGDPCGFVVRLENGFTIYHAGDTAVFGDMALIGELYEPDMAILPIGGHFTMGPREAAKAVELLGTKLIVPSHYGTFPVLTGTPDEFRRLVGGDAQILAVEPGGVIR